MGIVQRYLKYIAFVVKLRVGPVPLSLSHLESYNGRRKVGYKSNTKRKGRKNEQAETDGLGSC